MPNVRMHVLITGRVQGVFFRSETRKQALSLSLTGWVRNLADGRVEAIFEGAAGNVDAMLSWCRRGPPLAVVNHVDARHESCTGEFDSFAITF